MNRVPRDARIPVVRLLTGAVATCLLLWSGAVSDGPQNVCPDDTGAKDSSSARVTFGINVSTFRYEFDSGFLPSQINGEDSPVGLKAFYYASGGELDITATGILTTSWTASDAIPGKTVPIRIDFEGDAPGSQWTTEGGVRAGFRYKIDANAGGIHVQHEDYLPRVPKLDYTWYGSKDMLPLSLGVNVPLFQLTWGEGGLDCLAEAYFGSRDPAITCESGGANPTLDFEIVWGDPEAPDTTDAGNHVFCVPFWPHPSVQMHFCIDPGLCTGLSWEGVQLEDESTGKKMTAETGEVIMDSISVPCDFAQASDQDRMFSFTKGPFDYDAQLLFDVIGKGEPVVMAYFVKLVELTLEFGSAICAAVIPSPIWDGAFDMPYSKMDATFEMKIADPLVDDIVVGSGSGYVPATDLVDVTWCTTWGAPDACDCRARLDYRFRPVGTSTWGPWVRMHATEDTLNYGSWQYIFPEACNEAEVRIEFRDPASQPLDTLISDVFLITPVAAEINPYKVDFGVTSVGNHKDRTITITNPGPSELFVTVGAGCLPHFTVISGAGGPFQLTTGGTHNAVVRFEPHSSGTKLCSLPVTLNGTTCNFPLKGYGVGWIPALSKTGTIILLLILTLVAFRWFRRSARQNPLG